MTPDSTANSQPSQAPASTGRKSHFWRDSAVSALFIVLCLELSIILCVYPWMPVWNRNWFLQLKPDWQPVLLSDQFRGALTGLGILNLFIAAGEIGRLARSIIGRLKSR
jgi:hypothetical protein